MKLTSRLAVMFAVFLSLFGMLGMRLWFVQVAEGAQAAEITETQSWVHVPTRAPRGDIRDRNGNLLVTSRYVPAVVVDRHLVSKEQREQLVQRLSGLLAIPADEIAALYDEAGVNGSIPVAIVDTVEAYQVGEQLRDFPGVRIEKIPERVYLGGDLMAHVLGQLGLPTDADLEERPELDPNVRIGQSGVEDRYDEYLTGTPGEIAYQVRDGEVIAQLPERTPTPGDTVYLSLDLSLQEVVRNALAEGIRLSNEWKAEQRRTGSGETAKNETVRGTALVLEAQTGAVLAMSSLPSFDPSLFVGGLDPATYEQLAAQKAFLNLAVSGLYPPASTFKAVTYTTMLEEGVPLPAGVEGVDPGGLVHCDGRLELPGLGDGSPQVFNDWYRNDKGWLDIHGAFEQSCNIFFYSIALGIWQSWRHTPRENVIQDLARDLGFGSPTGIDLPGDLAGIVPDRELFREWQAVQREDEEAPKLLDPSRLDLEDPWFGGDLMNVAIGQGAMSATPLQVAVAYAALANGGRVFTPFVVEQVRDEEGALVAATSPDIVTEVPLDPATTQSFLSDLNRVVTAGTAAAAFRDFGDTLHRVGGKTGTGQSVASRDNHAWFVGVAPVDDPRYVVVVLIDEGGSGGAVAAPVARQIMQHLMGEDMTPLEAGASAQ